MSGNTGQLLCVIVEWLPAFLAFVDATPLKQMLEGGIPIRQRKMLEGWMAIHEDELMANWKMLSAGEGYFKIEPLK